MFCPNYTNKEVFKEFNDIVTAFGGKPMTEEEFKSRELRNQRSGQDLEAAKIAYLLWHLNNGYGMNMTPNGKQSKLFLDLVRLTGSEQNAILEKAKVYTKNFTDWFGDWINDPENSSKVVDENGEPLVVFHHTDNPSLEEFRNDFDNYFSKFKNGTKSAIFFTTNEEKILDRKYTIPIFLNLKTPFTHTGTKEQMHENGTSYTLLVNEAESQLGAIFNGLDDNKLFDQTVLVAYNPNQAKAAVGNNGDYSLSNNNIYAIKIIQSLQPVSEEDILSSEDLKTLESKQQVSSRNILNHMLENDIFVGINKTIAKIFAKHDIPVLMGETYNDVLAVTATDKTGGSVIYINRNALSKVSKKYASEAMLHEIVHAITVNAINNPQTAEERAFAESNSRAYKILSKIFNSTNYDRIDYAQGWYALNNEKEFAAVFMSNEHVRDAFFEAAKSFDNKIKNKIQRALRRLINNFTNMIVHKRFFDESTAEQTISQYKQTLFNYVLNANPIQKGNILEKSDLMKIYNSISDDVAYAERDLMISRALNIEFDAYEYNPSVTDIASYKEIIKILNTRLLSIRNSYLSKDQVAAQSVSIKTQVQLLNSDNVAKYVAVSSIINTIGPLIQATIKDLRENGIKDEKHLRHLLHSEFGVYSAVLEQLKGIFVLSDAKYVSDMIEQYNRMSADGQKISTNDTDRLFSRMSALSETCSGWMIRLQSIQKQYVIQALKEGGKEVGSSTMESYVNKVFEVKNQDRPSDISSLEYWFGATDAIDDESVRYISHLVKNTEDIATEATINKALLILQSQNSLRKKSHILRLYEVDDRGITTGYLVRDRNFGKFYNDFDQFLKQLNQKISQKYNIPIDDENRCAPDLEDARKEWLLAKNEWLDMHCDQQYTKEYYDAWAEISQDTRELMRDINNMIYSITHQKGAWDEENNTCDYTLLSDDDWEQLLQLFIRKRLMRSYYDEFGNKKEEGTPAYKIAHELNNLYEKLYPKNKVKYNRSAWERARNSIIEKCGGFELYEKWKNGEDNTFDSERLQNWDARNSKLEFKKYEGYEDELAIIFQDIEREMRGIKPYYGEEYEELGLKINDLLKPFKMQNGEINAEKLPEKLKSTIKDIIKKRSQIRRAVLKNNKTAQELASKYGQIYNKYIDFVDTVAFKKIKDEVLLSVGGDPIIADMLMGAYGDTSFDGIFTYFQPYRWYQTMRAKDIDKYMVLNPGDGWIDRSENDTYVNKDYVESYNTKYVPKTFIKSQNQNGTLSKLDIKVDTDNSSKYNNKEAYDKAREYKELRDYYDNIYNTIVESNQLQTNRPVVDNFLLPQVTGSIWKRMRNKNWIFGKDETKWLVLKNYIKEFFGKIEEDDYTVYGSEATLNNQDEMGRDVKSVSDVTMEDGSSAYKSAMPDGSVYRAIPQFFTRKLKDTSRLSSDLSGIVIGYYNMSKKYSEKSKIADKCELILEQLKNTTFTESNESGNLNSVKSLIGKQQGDSNIYKTGRSFLDSNLYDIKMILLTKYGYNLTKFASNFKMWTTATNLGLNPKVAITGFLTTAWTHTVNAFTGLKYDKTIATKSAIETLVLIGKSLFGVKTINNCLSNNKQMLLMEMCNVSNLLRRKYEKTNRNRLIEAINRNSIFGLMSTCDYIMKAQIMTSVMMSYRFVDGEFITKDDIRRLRYKHSQNWKHAEKELMRKWKSGKSLYDVLYAKNNAIHCEDLYKDAFNKIKNVVINRAQKYSEHADGMATEQQKGSITRSIIGSFILIHRQYLPLMLQERFGNSVYDYDTHQMKNGQFRTLIRFCYTLAVSNRYMAFGVGFSLPLIIGSGLVNAVIAGFILSKASGYTHNLKESNIFHAKEYSSMKDVYKDWFRNYSDEESTIKSLLNSYNIKQIVYEISLFKAVVSTLASIVCFYADDHKKNRLLQAIAFWLRGLQWESFTPYRFNDILNNIKSPSATLGQVDSITAFLDGGNMGILDIPLFWLISLLGSPLGLGEYGEEVSRGTYEGLTKQFKKSMKIIPMKNAYEQVLDSKSKRDYFEKLVMKINKKEELNSYLYNIYQSYLK